MVAHFMFDRALNLFSFKCFKNNIFVFLSDDSSIDDVINSCLTACNKRSIDHYLKKSQSHINNMETIIESDRLENEDVSFIDRYNLLEFYLI